MTGALGRELKTSDQPTLGIAAYFVAAHHHWRAIWAGFFFVRPPCGSSWRNADGVRLFGGTPVRPADAGFLRLQRGAVWLANVGREPPGLAARLGVLIGNC